MNLRQYAEQNPQEEQQAQQAQEVARAYIDLDELRAAMAQAVKEEQTQAAALQRIITKYCGQEIAAAAAEMPLKAAPQGAGLLMLIADTESQIAANKRKQQRLEKELSATREQGEELREELAELKRQQVTDSGAAIAAALSLYRQMQQGADPAAGAAALYKAHKGQRAAMGLLYGILREKAAQTGFLDDLQQYAELMQLADQIKAAAEQ